MNAMCSPSQVRFNTQSGQTIIHRSTHLAYRAAQPSAPVVVTTLTTTTLLKGSQEATDGISPYERRGLRGRITVSHIPYNATHDMIHTIHTYLHRVKVGADGVDELKTLLIVGHRQSALHDIVGVLVEDELSYPPLLRQLFHELGLRTAPHRSVQIQSRTTRQQQKQQDKHGDDNTQK